jgi:mannose-6-phosphate isomerase-like protein (cupin superfamily)
MTTPANRFVVGPDPQGRSAVLQRGLTNVQSRERLHWSATRWATEETPVDKHDRRRPVADTGSGREYSTLAERIDLHHTDTLDCLTCVRGEIHLVTDTDEVLMQPGDTVIIRGVNHAWSNRSSTPCLLAFRVGLSFSILNCRSVRETHMGRRANKQRVIP